MLDIKALDLKVLNLKVLQLNVLELKVLDLKVLDLKVLDLKVLELKVELRFPSSASEQCNSLGNVVNAVSMLQNNFYKTWQPDRTGSEHGYCFCHITQNISRPPKPQ